MADVVRYVNTDNDGIVDGLSEATGYTTRASWELNEATDLVADGDNHIVHCSGTTPDVASCIISTNWTTGPNNRITVKGNRLSASGFYDGDISWSENHFRAQLYGYDLMTTQVGYVTFDGLQLWQQGPGSRTALTYNKLGTIIRNCRIRGSGSNGQGVSSPASYDYQDAIIENNLVYGLQYGLYIIGRTAGAVSLTVRIQNNTIWDCTTGVLINFLNVNLAQTISQKNNVFFTNGTDISEIAGLTYVYDSNAGEDTPPVGTTNAQTLGALSTEFVDAEAAIGTENVVPLPGASCDGNGVGYNSDSNLPVDDIRDLVRDGTATTIGAFRIETPAGGGVDATGDLVSQAATVSGVGIVPSFAVGDLVSQAATVDGTGELVTPGNAPVIETTEVGVRTSAGPSVFVDKPVGTANAELIIFPHGSDGGSGPPTLSPPVGGFRIVEDLAPSDASVGAIHRLTTGPSEPAQYEAFCSENEKQVLIALRITGSDPNDAVDGFSSQSGTNAQTPTSPDLTTVASDCRIIRVLSYDYAGGTLNINTGYPAGTTGHYLRGSNASGGAGATILGSADSVKSTPGSVGPAEWNPSGMTAASWVAFTIAIKPGVISNVGIGDLQAQAATVSGLGEITNSAIGDLDAQAATVSGLGVVPSFAVGDLQAQAAVVDGTGSLPATAIGDLIAQAATVSGLGSVVVLSTGDLIAQEAVVYGRGSVPQAGTGDLIAQSAIVFGRGIVGDGWSPVGPGDEETWTPVDTGSNETWVPV